MTTESDEYLVNLSESCKEQVASCCLLGQRGAYPAIPSACMVALVDLDLIDSTNQELLLQALMGRTYDIEMTVTMIQHFQLACLK